MDSESSSPTRGSSSGSNRLSISMVDASPNQADLLGLGDSAGSLSPTSPAVSDINSRGSTAQGGSRPSVNSTRSVSSNPQAPHVHHHQQLQQEQSHQPFQPSSAPPSKAPPKPTVHRDSLKDHHQQHLPHNQIQQWPPYQHPQAVYDLQQKQVEMYDKEVSRHPSVSQESSASEGRRKSQMMMSSPEQQGRRGSVDPFRLDTELVATEAPLAGLSSTAASSTASSLEYVAVIPVTEMGLGLFLKDESGQVVIGGFRSPRTGLGINPSQRAGVKLGDILVRVNGVAVSTVAQTIGALRESRMEQVIALTLRKSEASSFAVSGGLAASMNAAIGKRTPSKPGKTYRSGSHSQQHPYSSSSNSSS